MSLTTNTFKPVSGAMDFSSIISDYMVYGNGKCQEFKPDKFIVLNAGDEGKIIVDCGRIKITSKCSTETILFDRIELRENGNHVAILCCEDAKKHKYKIKCRPTGNCDTTLMRINLKKFFGCDEVPMLINNSMDFKCTTGLTCSDKVLQFVAYANANQSYATFAVDTIDPETITVEWNEAGVVFSIEAIDGFFTEQLMQFGHPAIGKGKDLKTMMPNANDGCLPTLCDTDKCYKLFVYLTNEWINNAGHGLFSSSTGINNNNSFVMVRKLNWIAVDAAATAVLTTLTNAFNAGPYKLICDTTCISQDGNCVRCISRDDDGSPAALILIKSEYSTAIDIVLSSHNTTTGVSKYNATFVCSAVPVAIAGDTISNQPCSLADGQTDGG